MLCEENENRDGEQIIKGIYLSLHTSTYDLTYLFPSYFNVSCFLTGQIMDVCCQVQQNK